MPLYLKEANATRALGILILLLALDGVHGQVSGNTYVTTSSTSAFGEIKKAWKDLLAGFVLVALAYPMVWYNERRQAKMWTLFGRAADIAVQDVPPEKVDPANNAKLVHVVGVSATADVLRDEDFKVEVKNCAKLSRKVEMYQWKEIKDEKSSDDAMGGTTTTTTYEYQLDWDSDFVDSNKFAHPAGHENPPMPLKSKKLQAVVTLGAFTLPPRLTDKMGNFQAVTAQEAPPEVGGGVLGWLPLSNLGGKTFKLSGNVYSTVEADQPPKLGDMRVTFEKVPCGDCTVLAVQNGESLAPLTYTMKVKDGRVVSPSDETAAMLDKAAQEDDLEAAQALLKSDDVSLCTVCTPTTCQAVGALIEANEEIFQLLERRATLKEVLDEAIQSQKCWHLFLQILSFFMFFIGHWMIFAFVPSLFRVIPLIGIWVKAFANFFAGIAAFLISVVVWTLTSALAWLSMRPVKAMLLLSVAVLLIAVPTILASKMD